MLIKHDVFTLSVLGDSHTFDSVTFGPQKLDLQHNLLLLLLPVAWLLPSHADLEQAALELDARRSREHHLAAPLELKQVLQVPGATRVAQLKGT